ncbi:hypothetical protein [Pseudolysinimonas sp.]|uniref:hypothetical protein n=1 Tax=Pseudolysinimonas sp. TaxID=2680009 RepID=UPI003F820473
MNATYTGDRYSADTYNQPCPAALPWCKGHNGPEVQDAAEAHQGTIGTVSGGDKTVDVTALLNTTTGHTSFSVYLDFLDLEPGTVVAGIRDLRVIANKLEALLTTWKPENAAVTL